MGFAAVETHIECLGSPEQAHGGLRQGAVRLQGHEIQRRRLRPGALVQPAIEADLGPGRQGRHGAHLVGEAAPAGAVLAPHPQHLAKKGLPEEAHARQRLRLRGRQGLGLRESPAQLTHHRLAEDLLPDLAVAALAADGQGLGPPRKDWVQSPSRRSKNAATPARPTQTAPGGARRAAPDVHAAIPHHLGKDVVVEVVEQPVADLDSLKAPRMCGASRE